MQFAFIAWNHTLWSSRISGLNGNMIEVYWTHSSAWAAFHFLLWSSGSLRIYFCMVPSAILAFVPSKWWRDLDSRSSVTCPVCTIYHFLQILSSCTIFIIDSFLLFYRPNKNILRRYLNSLIKKIYLRPDHLTPYRAVTVFTPFLDVESQAHVVWN